MESFTNTTRKSFRTKQEQLPVKEWHGYIGEPTIADAIMV